MGTLRCEVRNVHSAQDEADVMDDGWDERHGQEHSGSFLVFYDFPALR